MLTKVTQGQDKWWQLSLLVALWLPSAAFAEDAPAVSRQSAFLGGFITESRVVYPLRVGDWEAGREHRYDDPEAGISIRYQDAVHTERWMDVYFFPAGRLSERQVEEVARGTLRELENLASVPTSSYRSVRAGTLGSLTLKGDPPRKAYSAILQMDTGTESRHSGLGLMLKNMYLVKIRYSVPATDLGASEMEDQLRTVLQALDARSSVVSTGDCWKPLPIVERPTLDAKAAGSVMSSDKDGTLETVVFGDRVEVCRNGADAGSAAAMSLLGAILAGAIAPDCVQPEDINPEVGDGMREISVEYARV